MDRRHFELCVFYHITQALRSGDLCIEGSEQFADYTQQLIDWKNYEKLIGPYSHQVGLPTDPTQFIRQLKENLKEIAKNLDSSFTENIYFTINNGIPKLAKHAKSTEPKELKILQRLISERLETVSILDVLHTTQHWLKWDKHFGPLSGFETKLEEPSLRYLFIIFCYGCFLGPTQTARCVKTVDRFQLSRINQRHVTEETLNKVIVDLINAYSQFQLPKYWGSGKSASVDGTKWDVYEQNLLAEYHIRYGGYGGIGYYHVSDNYIALFSRFIPCGMYEAIYILDPLLQNESEIKPDIIHGDTHSQSEVVFGLAYLLGIKLMPRIRSWKNLTFYRPDSKVFYKHIDELFSAQVNWEIIEKYLPEMFRVALSIKEGTITASSILKRLGSYSRKNRLHQAFQELGRVVRTQFLLEYIGDVELRKTIQAATCKSESYNNFAQWAAFGSEGVITENNRDEQRKIIKYNHLVTNSVILYNVFSISNVLNSLLQEGYQFDGKTLEALSPYITHHINRFGDYHLNFDKELPPLRFDIEVVSGIA